MAIPSYIDFKIKIDNIDAPLYGFSQQQSTTPECGNIDVAVARCRRGSLSSWLAVAVARYHRGSMPS
jgi:hypothetical protein